MCYDPLRFILCLVVCHPLTLHTFLSVYLSLSFFFSISSNFFFFFILLGFCFFFCSSPHVFCLRREMLCFAFRLFSCSSPRVSCGNGKGRGKGGEAAPLLSPSPCCFPFFSSPPFGVCPFPFGLFLPFALGLSFLLSFFSLGLSLSFPFHLFQVSLLFLSRAFPRLSVSIFGHQVFLVLLSFPSPFSFFLLASPLPFRLPLFLSGFSCHFSIRSFPLSFVRSLFISGLSFWHFPFGPCLVLSLFSLSS